MEFGAKPGGVELRFHCIHSSNPTSLTDVFLFFSLYRGETMYPGFPGFRCWKVIYHKNALVGEIERGDATYGGNGRGWDRIKKGRKGGYDT
jgi:hypothetical protein